MSQRTNPCRKAMRSDDSDAADGQPLAKVAKRCMVEDDDINSAENPLSQELTRTGSEIGLSRAVHRVIEARARRALLLPLK